MDGQVTAFFEERIVARGSREAVTRAVEEGYSDRLSDVRVFEDESGRVIDLDIWDAAASAPATAEPRGRGRPKLGVTSREVTLLPRQWDWLSRQPGGASAAIRRLVEAARKDAKDPAAARDSVYRFLTAMAGDRPNYEEAIRALYHGETERLRELIADWPEDVRAFAGALLGEGPVADAN
jgi:hypothetical protein